MIKRPKDLLRGGATTFMAVALVSAMAPAAALAADAGSAATGSDSGAAAATQSVSTGSNASSSSQTATTQKTQESAGHLMQGTYEVDWAMKKYDELDKDSMCSFVVNNQDQKAEAVVDEDGNVKVTTHWFPSEKYMGYIQASPYRLEIWDTYDKTVANGTQYNVNGTLNTKYNATAPTAFEYTTTTQAVSSTTDTTMHKDDATKQQFKDPKNYIIDPTTNTVDAMVTETITIPADKVTTEGIYIGHIWSDFMNANVAPYFDFASIYEDNAKTAQSMMEALPEADSVATSDEEAITKARTYYDTMAKESRDKVSEDALTRLQDAEKALASAKKAAAAETAQKQAEAAQAAAEKAQSDAQAAKADAASAATKAAADRAVAEQAKTAATEAQKQAEAARTAAEAAKAAAESDRADAQAAKAAAQEALSRAQTAQKQAAEYRAQAQAALKQVQKTADQIKAAAKKPTTVAGVTYKATSVANGTAAVSHVSSAAKSVTIKSSVKIGGKTYKVTKVSAKAFANNKKLQKVAIGANVKSVGGKAFYKDGNLKTVVFKGKKLTSVGSQAFKGISKNATVKAPKSVKAQYRALLKKAGVASSVKFK